MARKRKIMTDSRPLADRDVSAVASRRQHRRILAPLVMAACLQLQGCVAVGVTMAGLGFTNQLGGIQYRTFTEPLPRVSRATMTAFKRMAINVEAVENTKE